MKIEIKRSIKPINYIKATNSLEEKVDKIINEKDKTELIWFLEHPSVYTGGIRYKKEEILDNSINIVKTKRGGKITLHNPGQLIVYFVINLNKRKKDIRNLVTQIENVIISFLKLYQVKSYSDKKKIGVWVKGKKIAAIGIRVSRWVAFHGFSINIENDLNEYKKIIPCGLDNKNITSLIKEKKDVTKVKRNLKKIIFKYLQRI